MIYIRWSLISILLIATVSEAGSTPVRSYSDPAGRFSVTMPPGWKVSSATEHVRLTDPEDRIRIYLLNIAGHDIEKAVADGWKTVAPDFEFQPVEIRNPPPTDGVERIEEMTYDTGDRARQLSALARVSAGRVYITLIDGDADALDRRESQVNIVREFRINTVRDVDLRAATPKRIDSTITNQLERYVLDAMNRAQVPGVQVGIVQDGKIVFAKGFGVRDDEGRPVNAETQMMIGSVTKSMTTLMMATLVDDRKMAWDTPVSRIYPPFALADPFLDRKITMRNMVCACIGIPRRDLELMFTGAKSSPLDLIHSLETFKLATPPGEAFQYSNQLVAAGGYIATIAAGAKTDDIFRSYVKQMDKRVFGPIGMSRTTFSVEQVMLNGNYAMPHAENVFNEYSAVPLQAEEMIRSAAPSGLVWSNVLDMSRYLITEINEGIAPNGRRIVSAHNLKATWTPQVQASPKASYGLGWGVGDYKGQRMIQHNGEPIGFTSDVAFLPDARIGVVVISNSSAGRSFNAAVRTRVFELAFGLPMQNDARFSYNLKLNERAASKVKASLEDGISLADVRPFLGVYTNPALGQLTVDLQGGKLVWKTSAMVSELRRIKTPSGRQYLSIDAPMPGVILEFNVGPDGRRTITVLGKSEAYEFTK